MLQKILSLLVLFLFAACPPPQAEEGLLATTDTAPAPQTDNGIPANRIEQLTGKVWLDSSKDNKLSVLFGIELALNMEKAMAERIREEIEASKTTKANKDKKPGPPPYRISPLARAWANNFGKTSLTDISARIDAWYKANPDKSDRLVMDVIWNELMEHPAKAPKAPKDPRGPRP